MGKSLDTLVLFSVKWRGRLWIAVFGCCLLGASFSVRATVLYEADFSVAGQGCTHVKPSGGTITFSAPSPVAGANWTLTYDAASISSDTTTNEFIATDAGIMRVQDWGGAGTLTSPDILIAQTGTVDIVSAARSIGEDAFNAGSEGITWFYQINTEPPVEYVISSAAVAGTDVGHTFAGVAVNEGDLLKVGFTVNVDGAGDGVEVSSLAVGFSASPTSSGMDLRAFRTREGAVVEFAAHDVEADGTIQLALMGEDGEADWQGTVEAVAGPQFLARFIVPGLETGENYHFKVRDEVGKWWDASRVTVQPFAAEMVSATLAGSELTFDTLPGHTYDIQWVPALGSEWQTVTNITASGMKTTVVVPQAGTDDASGFFRVQLK